MAYTVADRVKETTVVTGTGPATLLGAVSGYRTFASQLSIGDTCAYAIVNANASEWEVGIGTYSATNTLTRTTVHASTNSNAAVNFSAGTKDVFLSPTAETVLSDVTSTDGTVTLTKTGSIVDLSVAVAAATTNVIVQVRNNTGATLTKGTVVYINGSTGQLPTVTKALATSDATSAQTLGMISADLNDNSNGYVTIIGLIDDVDTKGYAAGTQLYLSGTVPGEFTNVKPYAPIHLVYVGVVERATVHGKIFVKVQNGYEMDELHNVDAYNPSNGDLLIYNTSTNLWTHSPQSSLTVAPSQVTGTAVITTDSRLSDNRTPLDGSVTDAKITASGLSPGKITGTAVITTDSRLSDSRTPTGSAGGVLAGTYPNPSFASTTGSGAVVLATTPTLTTATFAAGTISASTPNTITQTWNNAAVAFSALTENITDNASASASLLVDLQVGGVSKFAVRKDGTPFFTANIAAIPAVSSLTWYGNTGATTAMCAMTTGSFTISSNSFFGWTGRNSGIYQPVDHTYEYRGGTNPQSFRVYNTYTNSSTYERASISWASNVCTLTTESATAGAGRNLVISAGNGVTSGAGGSVIFQAGAQATTGGDGNVIIRHTDGVTNSFTFVTGNGASQSTALNVQAYGFIISSTYGVQIQTNFGVNTYSNGVIIKSGVPLCWHTNVSNGFDATTAKVALIDDAQDVLAQRRSINPQSFRIYNTYTDASNYERLGITWATNTCTIASENAGAGTKRDVKLEGLNATVNCTGAGTVNFAKNGTTLVSINNSSYAIVATSGYGIQSGTDFRLGDTSNKRALIWPSGTSLIDDAANIIGIRNGVNAQSYRVYNTYTDASNYERLGLTWASNVCTIGLEQAGTGSTRNLAIAGANATTGAGGNVTISGGNGSGVGAGGNIILQPGAQGTSGGNGTTVIRSSGGSNRIVINDGATYEFKDTGATTRLTIDCRTSGWNIYNGSSTQKFQISGTPILDMNPTDFNAVMLSYTSIAWSMNTPATFSTDQTDYLLADNGIVCKKIHRLATTNVAGNAIHSFKVYYMGWGGHELTIVNVGSYNLTIKHNSTTGTAAWRIFNATGSDIILGPNDKLDLMYDNVNNGSGAAGWRAW